MSFLFYYNCINYLLFVSGNGGCDPFTVDEDGAVCPHGGVCIEGRCSCEDTCPYVFQPICGNDGTTYDNECLLKLAGCRRRSPINIRHNGECGKPFFKNFYNAFSGSLFV